MSLKRIERKEVFITYYKLSGNLGFYRIRPGKEPYICLNEKLLQGGESEHLAVYQTLLDYHLAIPNDSLYRCFPMVRYYEELAPAVQEEAAVEVAKEDDKIIVFARAARRWNYPIYYPDDYRLIGR